MAALIYWQASHSSPFFMASMEQTRFSSAEYTRLAGAEEALSGKLEALGSEAAVTVVGAETDPPKGVFEELSAEG